MFKAFFAFFLIFVALLIAYNAINKSKARERINYAKTIWICVVASIVSAGALSLFISIF